MRRTTPTRFPSQSNLTNERWLLDALLRRIGRVRVILELLEDGTPGCPALGPHAGWVIQADVGDGSLALSLPFGDRAVDGVVSVRLSQAMPSEERRQALLAELLRVSRRYVIVSYRDREQSRFDRAAHRGFTLGREELVTAAHRAGAVLVGLPLLAGQRYALLHKARPAPRRA